ncbi:hypothetical protein PR202_ga25764 [Eleusine coracana subsp. coracana]|uniref:Peptidyl-tRNA hydrolase family protein n=1 Tax=Eleusine coracana subsp. coracana TaxID=191504 RepID=A0AAV5DBU2_ELECO|nr:hypothetical protein PR202_ga25764 [Eleusine coracana subsp. coracana]
MREMLRKNLTLFISRHYISSFQTSSLSSSTVGSPIQPWLFIGLGNPGEKYQSTRHNVSCTSHLVGFDMIDAFAQSEGIPMTTHYFKALFGQGMVDGVPILLAKPQTYMNLSGESAGPLAAYYKLPLNRVLVAYDDMDLPCGVLRLQPKGGYGRHNGLVDLVFIIFFRRQPSTCCNLTYLGIGRPPGQMDPKAFVLQKFNRTGRERVNMS